MGICQAVKGQVYINGRGHMAKTRKCNFFVDQKQTSLFFSEVRLK